jgi:hypothetical protein
MLMGGKTQKGWIGSTVNGEKRPVFGWAESTPSQRIFFVIYGTTGFDWNLGRTFSEKDFPISPECIRSA